MVELGFKLSDWDLLVRILNNVADNIREDVLVDSDEVKAFAEVCLLKHRLEKFIADFTA
jgi:phage FluMu gp28-like protein